MYVNNRDRKTAIVKTAITNNNGLVLGKLAAISDSQNQIRDSEFECLESTPVVTEIQRVLLEHQQELLQRVVRLKQTTEATDSLTEFLVSAAHVFTRQVSVKSIEINNLGLPPSILSQRRISSL